MSQLVGSNGFEEKVYLYYHQDGLIDIFVGLGLLCFGFGLLIGQPWLGGIFPALILPIWQLAKKLITAPRVERLEVPFSEQEAERVLKRMMVAGLITLTATMLLGLFVFWIQAQGILSPEWKAWLRENFGLAFGLAGALLACLSALMTGINRFYLYGALTALIFIVGYILGAGLVLLLILVGLTILACGLGLLIWFLAPTPATY